MFTDFISFYFLSKKNKYHKKLFSIYHLQTRKIMSKIKNVDYKKDILHYTKHKDYLNNEINEIV